MNSSYTEIFLHYSPFIIKKMSTVNYNRTASETLLVGSMFFSISGEWSTISLLLSLSGDSGLVAMSSDLDLTLGWIVMGKSELRIVVAVGAYILIIYRAIVRIAMFTMYLQFGTIILHITCTISRTHVAETLFFPAPPRLLLLLSFS